LAADADAVTQRLAAGLLEVEIGIGGVDDERADRLFRLIVDERAAQMRRKLLGLPSLGTILGRQRRVDATLLRTPFLLERVLLTRILAADWSRRTQDVERARQRALSRIGLIGWRRFRIAEATATWIRATRIRLVSQRRLLAIGRTTTTAARIARIGLISWWLIV